MEFQDNLDFHALEAQIQLSAHKHHMKRAREAYLEYRFHIAAVRDFELTSTEQQMTSQAENEADKLLWIEVDDYGSLERKCNFFCDLHIVRPGKTQCNCPKD